MTLTTRIKSKGMVSNWEVTWNFEIKWFILQVQHHRLTSSEIGYNYPIVTEKKRKEWRSDMKGCLLWWEGWGERSMAWSSLAGKHGSKAFSKCITQSSMSSLGGCDGDCSCGGSICRCSCCSNACLSAMVLSSSPCPNCVRLLCLMPSAPQNFQSLIETTPQPFRL